MEHLDKNSRLQGQKLAICSAENPMPSEAQGVESHSKIEPTHNIDRQEC